jgi:hypothetical protein
MIKRLTTLLLVLVIAGRSNGQVNLQTGSATFSLPIFNWQDDKSRLTSVVALSYNSGNGLKVNDIASNIGQGWSLITGGEIVRLQAGEPDDQVARPGTDYDINRYPSGILYAATPAENGCPNALTRYPIYGWKNQLYAQHNSIGEDKQLDYFSFQFNGKAGMFVLDRDSIGQALPLGDTKMRITFQQDAGLVNQGIRTKITSFTIRDVDGLIYKFTKHGLTKVLRMNYCDEYGNYSQSAPKIKNGKVYYQAAFDGQLANPWVVGSWHLTEIEDALTHRKVFLNYATRTVNNTAGADITANYTNKDYCTVMFKSSKTQAQDISSIVYPDGHTVTINYGAARFDLNGQYAVSSIDVTYQGRAISKHELSTTYFILNRYGTPVTDYQKSVARLCLRSVRKIGVDLKEDTPPYYFDYYMGTGTNAPDDFIPPPFFYAKDIWGFYNGDYSKGFWNEVIPLNTTINTIKNTNQLRGLCFMRNGIGAPFLNAKPLYARNGLLKQIIYPTAGVLTYEYGQNKGGIAGMDANDVGGVHVTKTKASDGGFSNNCDNAIVTNYDYVMNGPGSSPSLWGMEMPKNKITSYNHYQPEYKRYVYSFPFGKCVWEFQHPGIQSQQQAINLTGFQKAMEALAPVLGILSVLGTINDVVTVASGGSPVGLIISIVTGLAELAISCIGDQSRDNTANTYFNSDLNAAAPLPAQFKRVEVIEGFGGNGKTVQEFTSSDDYAIWHPTNPTYSAKQRFAPWAYGLPKRTAVYDVNGNLVKSTDNVYSFNDYFGGGGHGQPGYYKAKRPLDNKSCKCDVTKTSSQRSTKWTDPAYHNPAYHTSSIAEMGVDIYDMYSGRVELKSTSEKVYKVGSPADFVETKTEYTYYGGTGTTNYEPYMISTQQSNGDVSYKIIKYSGNYQSYYNPPNYYDAGVLTNLNANNLISEPIAVVTAVSKFGGEWLYTGEKVTEFQMTPNGDIKPYRILEQRFDKPQPILTPGGQMNFKQYVLPGHPENPPYKQPQTFLYDAASRLSGVKDEGGRSVANIYDYDDKYVVASVINCDPAVDKPAYSSFETYDFGNWTLSGIVSIAPNTSITGSRSFGMSAGRSLSVSSLNTARPYTVSFWAKTPNITVTGGATLTKSAPTIDGFTYYEYDIAQGTSTVTVAGDGIMDELRLYPKTARMRTITYDPIIGKTSDCDENNRITYYEYDNLGRLRFIKDEKKNIVKMHEYNNVSAAKQRGCPGTYFNNFLQENFVRNNCPPGYMGDTVVYSVPASMFMSLISQEDADMQAQNYILTNGQAYANTNGVCRLVYWNTAISISDTTENCPPGYVGGIVTYTVPAGRYFSVVSQADADDKALDDLEANAAAYMNDPANAICTLSYDPDWRWLEGGGWYCQVINGTPHLFVEETDVNPNSFTYNQTRWTNVGPSELCATTTYSNIQLTYYFTRNDCPPGYVGETVAYTIPAGMFSSTVGQHHVNGLALAYANATGQAYANANGTCTLSSGCGVCTGDDRKCINNICEIGTWGVVSSVRRKVMVDGYLQFRWVCTWRYCFSDGSQSTYFAESYHLDPCPLSCLIM